MLFTAMKLWPVVLVAALAFAPPSAVGESTSETHDGLKRLLERYPEADQNRDGILTLEEARRFRMRIWQEETDAGTPIDREAPETKLTVPVHRFGDPHFARVPYGKMPGQTLDVWLPRNAVPPCPAVFWLTLDTDDPMPPAPFMEACLEAGIAVGILHGREEGDGGAYFEDVATALAFLAERAVAYGVMETAMALFGVGALAEQTLYGALLSTTIQDQSIGAQCAVILDARPVIDAGESTTAEEYLEIAYPRVNEVLAAQQNAPAIALLHTERHGGDRLHQALRLAGLDALMHNAAEGERDIHLLRMASLFVMDKLGVSGKTDIPVTETGEE